MEEKSQQKMSPKEMLEKLEKDFRERVNIFIINSKNFLIRKCKHEKFSCMPLSHSIQYRL